MKLTKNQIKKAFKNIYYLSYCERQDITCQLKEYGYNSGIYGWNYTCYYVNYNTCIITGYRGLFGEHLTDEKIEEIKKELELKF